MSCSVDSSGLPDAAASTAAASTGTARPWPVDAGSGASGGVTARR
jgi:hypothetical protein